MTDLFANSQPDGGDIRVAGKAGSGKDNYEYWLENYDQVAQTGKLWVKLPSVGAKKTEFFYSYYKHSPSSINTTGNRDAIFSYSSPQITHYVVDSRSVVNNLDLISFADSNSINVGGLSISLNKGQIYTPPSIPTSGYYNVTGPIQSSFSFDTTESVSPISYGCFRAH